MAVQRPARAGTLELVTTSVEGTEALGARLGGARARRPAPGPIVLLAGPLGAQASCAGWPAPGPPRL
jgi:hypothetical protein